MKQILTIAAGIGLIILAVYTATLQLDTTQGNEVGLTRGMLAPDFALKTTSGDQIRLSDLKGKPVLINFWATWCAPCRLEMPYMQSRYERFSPELEILAVNYAESADQVNVFQKEMGVTFDLLLDLDASIQDLYQVRGYPSSYFVDRDGIIQAVHIGIMTEAQLDDFLEELGLANQ